MAKSHTAKKISARERAHEALMELNAERLQRDEKIKNAAAAYFEYEDTYQAARTAMAENVAKLRELGENNTRIAQMLRTSAKNVRELLAVAQSSDDQSDEPGQVESVGVRSGIDQDD